MKEYLRRIKEKFSSKKQPAEDETGEDYVTLDTDNTFDKANGKVVIKTFVLESFDGIKPILDFIRQDYTVALVNIKTLKDKDMVDLKRSISKLKKTLDAMEGEIAGFGEDYVILASKCATIYKEPQVSSEEDKE